jgi:hypothetical protein
MPTRSIILGPSAEVALASMPKTEFDRARRVIELLRLEPKDRKGQLRVYRLREGLSKFIVRVGDKYRLIYRRQSRSVIKIEDIVRVDHLKSLEG